MSCNITLMKTNVIFHTLSWDAMFPYISGLPTLHEANWGHHKESSVALTSAIFHSIQITDTLWREIRCLFFFPLCLFLSSFFCCCYHDILHPSLTFISICIVPVECWGWKKALIAVNVMMPTNASGFEPLDQSFNGSLYSMVAGHWIPFFLIQPFFFAPKCWCIAFWSAPITLPQDKHCHYPQKISCY